MDLGEYIALLEKEDSTLELPIGFNDPHSYRGIYEELAFVIERDISISDMLSVAVECVDKTFEGFKGGDFKMTEHTDIVFVPYMYAVWEGSGTITPLLMRLLIAYANNGVAMPATTFPHPDVLLRDYYERP